VTAESATRIALVYPELLGTYGDGGNAHVLATRLRWRGLEAEIVSVPAGAALPGQCDIYLLGGGEDEPQVLAVDGLREGGVVARAVKQGAVVLAVCAGFQIAGMSFPGSDGRVYDGAGLIPVETRRSFAGPSEPAPPRAVGDIVVDPDPALKLPPLLGYENHGGRTRPVEGATGKPLGRVRRGIGNGTADRAEGWLMERIVGTYLHGPVLAQNPALADLLLRWVHPDLPPLEGPDEVVVLRTARMRALGV
jgi:hypothetical protein